MKKVLLGLSLLISCGAMSAEEQVMTLVTDAGQEVPVENVSFLLAADNDEEFQVVLKEGEPILNVKKATFELKNSGVAAMERGNGELRLLSVSSELTLTGCAEGTEIRIYGVAGTLVKVARAEGTTATVNVADLAPGYYVLDAGGSSVKFIKK